MSFFSRGVHMFRNGQFQNAVDCFSEALAHGEDPLKTYDSRAAAHEKLGKLKEALRDAKSTIDLQPSRWQGYARSARLFLQARKYEAAARMAELALERIPSDLRQKRDEMIALRDGVAATQAALAKLASQRAYHFGNLPLEIASTIFAMVLEDNHAHVIILAQVCKNWRAAIIGTPAFWGILVLGKRHPKRKLKVWLERSRNRIRELAVLEDLEDCPHLLEDLEAVQPDVLRSFRQEDYTRGSLLLQTSLSFRSVIPSLHQLTLHARTAQNFMVDVISTGSLEWQVLKLTNIILAFGFDFADRLSRLEHLSLNHCSFGSTWDGFLKLLLNNPRLTVLNFVTLNPNYDRRPDWDQPEEEVPLTIPMPHLTNIHIDDTEQLANVLLPRLDAPSLSSIYISLHQQRLDSCLSWLATGPAAKLTTLAIQRSPVTVHLLISVLMAAPCLETLQLTHVCNTAQKLLTKLATPLEISTPQIRRTILGSTNTTEEHVPMFRILCPALRNLDVSHCPDVLTWPLTALVKLRLPETQSLAAPAGDPEEEAKGTIPPVQPLQSLVIDGCSQVDPDVLPWLRAAVPFVSCIYLTKKNARWRR
ncbi:hypothetical protein BC628DRAFT_1312537 [Trametes gibbosa]|nr:hypothetical protein BC628DRAFT_1312537 [Trametes gibbosa]